MNKVMIHSVLFFSIMFLSGCADLFQGKVAMDADPDGTGSLKDVFRQEEEISKLSTPTQFYVSDGYSPSAIRLTWNGVTGAASYMIECAVMEPIIDGGGNITYEVPGNEDFEVLENFVYDTGYTHRVLTNPQRTSPEYQNKYYYRIIAENVGEKYDSSDPTAALSGTLFAPPSNVRASLGTSTTQITLQWEKVNGASSYTIYRSDYATGTSPYYMDSVYGNQMWYTNTVSEDEQGKEYYYSVYAINDSGNTSVVSNLAMGYALVTGAPDTPENVRLADNSGRGHATNQITIEWDASSEADYYAVYRYSSQDSSLTRLTENTTDTFWVDSKQLRPGLYYYYLVQSIAEDTVNSKVLKSQFSTDDVEGYILSPPSTVSAIKSSGGSVSIIWYPAIGTETEQSRYSYKVYADNNLAGTFTAEVASGVLPVTGSDGYIHADNVDPYTFYKVATVNTLTSAESSQSSVVSPAPAAAVILDATKAANLSGETANSSGVYPVKITWKKPSSETPAAYHVYRSTSPDSGFRKITDDPIDASAEIDGVFSFVDPNETAKVGKLYYYRVLSLNMLGQGSYFSDTRTGYGALTYEQYMLEFNKTVKSSHKKLTLMHKSNDMDKLGSETATGAISGNLNYTAKVQGVGARITMHYSNYADFYIENDSANGVYFSVTGDTNTTANMSANGSMDGTMVCTGMYPGKVYYDGVEIKGGSAGGGLYVIEPAGFLQGSVSWTVGER
ncbi:hypothetical protein K7I13_03160 [Brucepastera parasyntrophica]|uniref:fibronectin type III domain-containing protein n=1 Tax=Brucepastera parasyntrophica TaxID=2880008 RepID=UPI00210B56B5|nr:hypothetical protein [Brucepastera parasyntrophica]ULQ60321.1 hypothetical protein K7I13_03160 [Brucepastera parasyntrophica]